MTMIDVYAAPESEIYLLGKLTGGKLGIVERQQIFNKAYNVSPKCGSQFNGG